MASHSQVHEVIPLGHAYPSLADLPPVPVSQSPIDKFREYLALRGLKCTDERLKIVEHVFEKHNHFDADQLVASMHEKRWHVSRATVYRTLKMLVEAGMLRTLQFGPKTAYDHDYGYPHHEHLYCERCGTVIEFMSDELERLQDEVCQRYRFRAVHHDFVIQGVCENCNRSAAHRHKLDLI